MKQIKTFRSLNLRPISQLKGSKLIMFLINFELKSNGFEAENNKIDRLRKACAEVISRGIVTIKHTTTLLDMCSRIIIRIGLLKLHYMK